MGEVPIFNPDGQAVSSLQRPTKEEIQIAVEEALIESGIVPDAVDIIEGEHTIPQIGSIARVFPVHMAVVKSSGMVLFFAAAGPAGIHARVIARREMEVQ